jgi:hypothetical protein
VVVGERVALDHGVRARADLDTRLPAPRTKIGGERARIQRRGDAVGWGGLLLVACDGVSFDDALLGGKGSALTSTPEAAPRAMTFPSTSGFAFSTMHTPGAARALSRGRGARVKRLRVCEEGRGGEAALQNGGGGGGRGADAPGPRLRRMSLKRSWAVTPRSMSRAVCPQALRRHATADPPAPRRKRMPQPTAFETAQCSTASAPLATCQRNVTYVC